jgi:hypothetical protein
MEPGRTYTENELGEKVKEVETEIKSIFNKDFIPSFLVQKANRLFTKWKLLTNWKEDDTPAYEEPLEDKL